MRIGIQSEILILGEISVLLHARQAQNTNPPLTHTLDAQLHLFRPATEDKTGRVDIVLLRK